MFSIVRPAVWGLVICALLNGETPAGAALDEAQMQQWISMINSGKAEVVIPEAQKQLDAVADPAAKADLLYVLGRAKLKNSADLPAAAKAIDAFILAAPQDDRGAELLFRLGGAELESSRRISAYQRCIDQYGTSSWAQNSKGAIRRIHGIGQPFELKFNDLLTGKPIDVQKDYKGKVVVVEFWAGWCSDCAAAMPRMKSLYEQYKPQGVEFVGVSVDRPESEGGLVTMKSAIAKLGISWPQYYQGNYYQSEFSAGWGVNAVPWVFVLDQQGKLYSADALEKLDQIILKIMRSATEGTEDTGKIE